MRDIYDQIHELEGIPRLTKHEQFVQGIINAVDNRVVVVGDLLPSVNKLMNELGFARETIMKGYKELIKRGIVESRNRMGFFIASADTGQNLRVALLLYAFDTFQETFYKTFKKHLKPEVHLDVFFHHNNIDILDTIIGNIRGKYGMYVVAPIPNPRTCDILKGIPSNKFLMIDRFEQMEGDFSYVTQEFEQATYKAFCELKDVITRYDEFVFYYRPSTDTPIEILRSFKRFIKEYGIKGTIQTEYTPGAITRGKVYFTINNTELWAMLKDCIDKKLDLGTDVGILSHNDDMVKEIICGGITTYSTDFRLMAEEAASFVMSGKSVKKIIPTTLIRRKSL
ncbi:GntR family transcriptional regulator [Mucilaginibacter sp. X5P1]|uniref:GntR family transcriptional regulator n=1 Tax=Mucilaginibacter sp. X5P1 TaxID=2723088 RepID=UPI001607E525|nr:GntR family transcriptional regulator [Mucilaginibacter sp. X5P1]MBB6136859.1 DNA-binding transcriptional regulator YhcF (GntR family) [Mucilaginibacter sp. X5P1]